MNKSPARSYCIGRFVALDHAQMSSAGEILHGFYLVVLAIAIIVAMAGWVYALGWVALKVIEFI